MTDALRVDWEPVEDVERYEVHGSPDPGFEPDDDTRLATTSCGEGEECAHTDEVGGNETRYYRVLPDGSDVAASLLAPGTTQPVDAEVLVKADTVYGPAYWERADLEGTNGGAHTWSYRYALAGLEDPAAPLARSFRQGVGSPVTEAADEPGPDPREPGPPDDRPPDDRPPEDRPPEEPGPPSDRPDPPEEPGRPRDEDG